MAAQDVPRVDLAAARRAREEARAERDALAGEAAAREEDAARDEA